MNSWIATVSVSVSAGSLVLILVGLSVIGSNRTMEPRTKRFFRLFFILMMLYVLSNLVQNVVFYFAEGVITIRIPLFLESLFSAMLIPVLAEYLLYCCGEDRRKSTFFFVVLILWFVYAALLIVTQFTDVIYFFTKDLHYHRGKWYPVLLIPPILSSVTLLFAVIKRKKILSKRQFEGFLSYTILPGIAMLIQTVLFGAVSFIVLATALAAGVMLRNIARDQLEKYEKQQLENERLYANAVILQMRPHYIYNAMMSIYYLAGQDPEKARQVILDFTNYLRKNFSALGKEDMIPFTDELEHTRAYLAVEKARFEDNLFVEFDTPFTRFRIPPLTLQPIVENAVKHGMDPELEPLHISVRTRETKHGAEITVEDTGPGFDAADNDEPHVALENIKSRLNMMCGGSLIITSREGGGTIVRIVL